MNFPVNLGIQAGLNSARLRVDPFMAYKFHVEIDGIIVGGFSSVSGLKMKTEVHYDHEGGRPNGSEFYVGDTSYENITLSRGMSDVDMLFGWYMQVAERVTPVPYKHMTIFLLNPKGVPVTWWDLENALPVGWDGPMLEAESNTVATESITIAFERFVRPKAPRSGSYR